MSEALDPGPSAQRRASLVADLRRLSRPTRGARLRSANVRLAAPSTARQPTQAAEERCELCGTAIGEEHRHLLDLQERNILCVCHTCLALRSGDPAFRPTGTRVLWLEDFALDEETWSSFGIPIGLAFFIDSASAGGIAALYPSPAGATECELPLEAWQRVVAANPVLEQLEPDAEALIVDRLALGDGGQARYAIAPIDECYRLVGLIKANWQGISGGKVLESVVPGFFDELRQRAATR